jgi:hypothetical protein
MAQIRVDDDAHLRFKVACAKRGLLMKAAATKAINDLMQRWVREEQLAAAFLKHREESDDDN